MSKPSRSARSSALPAASPTDPVTRFQEGEVRRMSRASFHGATYNPRRIDKPALRRLRDNVKRVGLLGPAIVVNLRTGNVISGHRRLEVLDTLEGKPDYFVDVTAVDWDDATEREQNVFMNSPDAQGQFDLDLLGKLLSDDALPVAVDNIGLDRITLEEAFVGTAFEEKLAPVFRDERASLATRAIAADAARAIEIGDEERKKLEAAKKAKDIESLHRAREHKKDKAAERGASSETWVTLVFASVEEEAAFAEVAGYDPSDTRHIDGTQILKLIREP